MRILNGDRGYIAMGIPENSIVAEVFAMSRHQRHRDARLQSVEEEISKYRIAQVPAEYDIALWKDKDGVYREKFSTKATWNHIHVVRPTMENHKVIWFRHATPKYAFITWLVAKNRIATGERMQRWNQPVNTGCIFCTHPLETREHLFFQCPFSAQVWEVLVQKLLSDKFTNHWQDIMYLLAGSILDKTKRLIVGYAFQSTIHSIWRERNDRRHGEKPSLAETIVKFIDKTVRNRLSTIKEDGGSNIQVWFEARFY
ncbi:PREDICTED: uncharacterized protein LOC109129064 [Camelina sativa]|uniref:Uncharacterized protein LOC109129064 n=1 Tax=Camelina sativa TaxID=90675 RepID=A0ABM1QZJ8_CAMSA|nr:PREDICTED: uncharacterized protein LOC109129064 [Camelina sativa]